MQEVSTTGVIVGACLFAIGLFLWLRPEWVDGRTELRYLAKALVFGGFLVLVTLAVIFPESAPNASDWGILEHSTFLAIAAVTVVSSTFVATARQPRKRLWASVVAVLSCSGLMMLAGAWTLAIVNAVAFCGGMLAITKLFPRKRLTDLWSNSNMSLHEPLLASVAAGILTFSVVAASQKDLTNQLETRAFTSVPVASDSAVVTSPGDQSSEGKAIAQSRHLLASILFRHHFASIELMGLILLGTAVGVTLILRGRSERTTTDSIPFD